MMNHVVHRYRVQYLELRRTKMSGVAGVQNIQFWDNTEMVIFTALSNN